jgi:hypothetical protein
MSRRKEIDIEEFRRLYALNWSYPKMSEKLRCSVSVLNSYKIQLKLPPRERVYQCKEVDWTRFKELYESGAIYKEIGDALGISQNSVLRAYPKSQ